ncbi:MAG: M28 family peptidase [Candidatus Eisenbacteria bacterium]
MRKWLTRELRGSADAVAERPFPGVNSLTGSTFTGTNIIASFRPELEDRIFFGAHWDTRAQADHDPDPARRTEPVPGANDGGSGVAVLFALAEALDRRPPPVGVDLLFLDGEDQGSPGGPGGYCLGARAFAASSSLTGFAPRYGVIIDMVGHRNLRVARESSSMECCADWLDRIMKIGERIAPDVFGSTETVSLYDDHIPFIEAGIPTIVLSGSGYPEWHTTADLPDICSPGSLGAVGSLLEELVHGGHEIP